MTQQKPKTARERAEYIVSKIPFDGRDVSWTAKGKLYFIDQMTVAIAEAEQRSEPKPWPTREEFERWCFNRERKFWSFKWPRQNVANDIYKYLTKHAAPIGVGLSEFPEDEFIREWKTRGVGMGLPNEAINGARNYHNWIVAAQTTSIPRATIDEVVEALEKCGPEIHCLFQQASGRRLDREPDGGSVKKADNSRKAALAALKKEME